MNRSEQRLTVLRNSTPRRSDDRHSAPVEVDVRERGSVAGRRRAFGTTAIASVLAVTAAACGSDDDSGARSTSEVPAAIDTSASVSLPMPTTTSVALPATAVWTVGAGDVNSESDSFTALVMRLECNDGVTGAVYPPTVDVGSTEIVVSFTVEPAVKGVAHTCPSNDQVPVVVELGEPIGERRLVDGACRVAGTASATALCVGGGVRG